MSAPPKADTQPRAVPVRPPAARPSRRHRLDIKYSAYAYISPFFLLFFAFGLFPLAYTAWVSLYDWNLLSSDQVWVGLDNYRELLADGYFWNAAFNTLSIG